MDTSIYSGDSASWTFTSAAYPASSGYSGSLILRGRGSKAPAITLAASGSGSTYTVALTPEQSAFLPPGPVDWHFLAAKTGSRFVVCTGVLQVAANPSSSEPESYAEKMLALIRAALLSRVPKNLESLTIEGVSLSQTPMDTLQQLESVYLSKVAEEKRRRAARESGALNLCAPAIFR